MTPIGANDSALARATRPVSHLLRVEPSISARDQVAAGHPQQVAVQDEVHGYLRVTIGTAALARRLEIMAPPDDIPLDTPPSQTERAIAPKDGGSRRKVAPESEVRGGPEATEERLDDPKGDVHRVPR